VSASGVRSPTENCNKVGENCVLYPPFGEGEENAEDCCETNIKLAHGTRIRVSSECNLLENRCDAECEGIGIPCCPDSECIYPYTLHKGTKGGTGPSLSRYNYKHLAIVLKRCLAPSNHCNTKDQSTLISCVLIFRNATHPFHFAIARPSV